jgi:surfeit locus 1 family protein
MSLPTSPFPLRVAILATALLVAACVALGCWQLGRSRQKQALIDEFESGEASVIDVSARTLAGLPRYQSVSADGAYDPRRQILLDNMPSVDGRPGYRVLTPFRRDGGGSLLLVDRGWVSLGESREHRPALDVAGGERRVVGRLDRLPVPGLRLGDRGVTPEGEWPRVMNFPTAEALAEALGSPVEPQIVLLDPRSPDGYERKWQPALRVSPARHLAYAIQWFAFGGVALLALLLAALRRRRLQDARAT